jgi:hypothetical protein
MALIEIRARPFSGEVVLVGGKPGDTAGIVFPSGSMCIASGR